MIPFHGMRFRFQLLLNRSCKEIVIFYLWNYSRLPVGNNVKILNADRDVPMSFEQFCNLFAIIHGILTSCMRINYGRFQHVHTLRDEDHFATICKTGINAENFFTFYRW